MKISIRLTSNTSYRRKIFDVALAAGVRVAAHPERMQFAPLDGTFFNFRDASAATIATLGANALENVGLGCHASTSRSAARALIHASSSALMNAFRPGVTCTGFGKSPCRVICQSVVRPMLSRWQACLIEISSIRVNSVRYRIDTFNNGLLQIGGRPPRRRLRYP